MMNALQKQEKFKRRFSLPNEVFQLDLTGGAKLVYAYLIYCEDRDTYQCVVSYKKIGRNVNMSVNTVRKYVTELVDKGLVTTENTTVTNKDGQKQNGCLRYTIRTIQEAVELHGQRQLRQLELDTARWRAAQALMGPPAKPSEAVSLGRGRTA